MTGAAAQGSRRLDRIAGALLLLGAACAFVGWLAISLVHLDDRQHVGHVQGTWMALARYTNDGTLYPPLYDGERYGGTRWMPLGIVLHALAARIVGSELLGGKMLVLATTVPLLALGGAMFRRLAAPWPIAAALLAAVLASRAGLFTTTTIGADVLAVTLQLAALTLFLAWEANDRRDSKRGLAVLAAAGLLAGLGPLAKLTGGWAALAIICRLVATRRWPQCRVFLLTACATTGAALVSALAGSSGRLWESLSRFILAGGTGPIAVVRAPNQVVYNIVEFAPAFLAVAPLAGGAVILARTSRGLSVLDWALAWAFVALLAAFSDIGTGLNQLIDVLVLISVVAAQLPNRLAERLGEQGRALAVGALALAAASALTAGVVVSLVPGLRTAVDVARHGHQLPAVPLVDIVGPDDSLLSEDPYVPVALGRDPVVLDAFMMRRLDATDHRLVDPLIERIRRGAYDHVVLLENIERREWWERYHFGSRIAEAIREAYQPAEARDGYLTYRPRGSND